MDLGKQAKLEQQAAVMRDAREELEMLFPQIAIMHYSYYTALKNAGFTSDQAIQLCIAHGATFGIPPIVGGTTK